MHDRDGTKQIGAEVYDSLLDDPEIGAMRIEREDLIAYFDAVRAEIMRALRPAFVRLAREAE